MFKNQHTQSTFAPSVRRSRRGESNALRRGQSKIHRRNIPKQDIKIPKGTPARLSRTLKSHDWRRDSDLIALRQKGYTPYSERKNPHYVPKPMRISTRSESREALTSLSLAFAANADFFPGHDYLFEVMAPFEFIAKAMGVLHEYENGRKSYDVALHALSVLEQMGQIVVHRDKDRDAGQNKPMRIWLKPEFFMSKGIPRNEIRQSLIDFQNWAIKSGQLENLEKKYQRHLLNMARLGIDVENKHALRQLLKKIKRSVVDQDLQEQKNEALRHIEDNIETLDNQTENLEAELERMRRSVANLRKKDKSDSIYWRMFVEWQKTTTPVAAHYAKNKLKEQNPYISEYSEQFYRLLLEQEGIILT
ncbi:Replication protein [Xenorhabdus khoisanae]|uniref:Replication protein n=1 Tax=Xenorhabdus khoisanae TaxID=880157 RepID=UPI002359B768|nr:Replication protein [Xenorhabdus khoisanae]MDC9615955.1 Replication protein [Xenorhabdus khoisanae]